MVKPRGWHHRGYLPHCDASNTIQAITYRFADSLPCDVLRKYQREVEAEPDDQRQETLRQRIEAFLDAGHGSCLLREPDIAKMVIAAWQHFDGDRYDLHAWVVMPNHVHVLCGPRTGHSLSSIINSWKSFTARSINRHLERSGSLWMEDYWDRFIRDEEHYYRAIDYILENPVKSGLAADKNTWPWSSACRSQEGSLEMRPGEPRSERHSDHASGNASPSRIAPT